MQDIWTEIDRELLDCLIANGPMAPHELAREMGISEGEATAFLAMLAREGKVRIRLVEAVVAAPPVAAARGGVASLA
jgi:DNA-binding Lrp family transcriptional regulator